jgi:hypothetical protein
VTHRHEIEYAERFRFDSPWLGLRLWREPKRRMWLEPVIRQGQTYPTDGVGIASYRQPDKLIAYWIKFEGLFPKRLDELLGETTTFEFRVPMADGPVRWFFESVTWMEGWDNEQQTAVIVGHAQRIRGHSRSQYVREQVGDDVEHSLAAWWRETEA